MYNHIYMDHFYTGLPIRTVGILEMFMKPLTKKNGFTTAKTAPIRIATTEIYPFDHNYM